MLTIKFMLKRYIFKAEISSKGIYSLHIEEILDQNASHKLIYISQRDYNNFQNRIDRLFDFLNKYFSGEPDDPASINIDLSEYNEKEIRIYKSLQKVPFGNITTYNALAQYVFGNNANRYIGKVLSRNRLQIIIPCHRVVKKDLEIGGFTSPLGIKLKILLLNNEGIFVKNSKIYNYRLYSF